MNCENCGCSHEGNYGSGRFCEKKCARAFSTKIRRKEINEKVSQSLSGRGHDVIHTPCATCGKMMTKSWSKRQRKTCGRFCGAKLGNSKPEKREALRSARIREIEKGNIGYGIKCFLKDVRCDSALEFAFLEWYWEQNPSASIKRFKGFLESEGTKYQPDFIIDDKIIVEVKYDTAYVGKKLNEKWKQYVEAQEKKKDMLQNCGYDFLWVTNSVIGNKRYRQSLRKVKELMKQ